MESFLVDMKGSTNGKIPKNLINVVEKELAKIRELQGKVQNFKLLVGRSKVLSTGIYTMDFIHNKHFQSIFTS